MYKLQKVIGLTVITGLLLSGCGQAGDPEIIMPDTPMQPSAAVNGGAAAEPVAAAEVPADAEAQETQPHGGFQRSAYRVSDYHGPGGQLLAVD